MYFSLYMAHQRDQLRRLSPLEGTWEQYRITHMFPEQAGTSTHNLLEQLVALARDLDARLDRLERRLAPRARRPRGAK